MKKYIFIYLLITIGFCFSQITNECVELTNIWFKVSTERDKIGEIIKLDMSKGQSYSDPYYIYLVVRDMETNDIMVVAFPNGGDWEAPKYNPTIDDMEGDIKDLEKFKKYLKDKHGTEIKKQ